MTRIRSITLLMVPLTLGLAACAGPRDTARTGPEVVELRAGDRTDSTTSPAQDKDLEALFWARQDSARTLYTEADVDFMMGMIAHHAQALVMSGLAPTNEASASVKTLAARIINAQNDEIATMQRWLEARGEVVPDVHIDGLELMIHGAGAHHRHMPGMLTRAQLEELAAAHGRAFDRLFLTYMIQHHRGAITMVDALFAEGGGSRDEAAFKLASDIHVDQVTEIARMERMLGALSDSTDGR